MTREKKESLPTQIIRKKTKQIKTGENLILEFGKVVGHSVCNEKLLIIRRELKTNFIGHRKIVAQTNKVIYNI